jgi:cytochrome c553
MHKLTWFLLGILALLATIAIAGALELWTARRARSLAVPANAKEQMSPSTDSPEVLAGARADHCAACHANNGGGVSANERVEPQESGRVEGRTRKQVFEWRPIT